MLFNSLSYALFLPVVFVLYWLIPHKYRWILLLASSYYFYMSWNPKYVVLIAFTTLVSYACGIVLHRAKTTSKKRICLLIALFSCLGVLFFFKYFNFATQSISNLLGMFSISVHPMTVRFLLPVGISFYTFQTLSYVIDIYRGQIEPEYNLGVYATYISFFPQLIAGPIERAGNLLPQIKSEKSFNYGNAVCGARMILWGLFKKVAVADTISVYVDNAYQNVSRCSGIDCILAIFFFTIQIYCDFSGYSDIAIGSAKLLGIDLVTNFKSPYFALSVKEFWSRWHISLSSWFKDYIYIPLGGSRCSKWKNYRNILITFLVSGLWHGASWTFVFWGGIHGLAQIIEKAFDLQRIRRNRIGKILSRILVFIFCNYAWVFFRAESFHDALVIIYHSFSSLSDISSYLHTNIGLNAKEIFISLGMIGIVAVYDLYSHNHDIISGINGFSKVKKAVCVIAEYVLIVIMIYSLEHGVNTNQFVYFQF